MSPNLDWQLSSQGRDPNLWRALTALPNVTYSGEVPLKDVPAVVGTFDVGIIPYTRSDFTVTSSPIKAYEYLALGRPAVSTRVADLQRLGYGIRLVDRADEWEDAIEESLRTAWDSNAVRARRAVVEKESNSHRAQRALGLIRETAKASSS
jgi:teichuronic acid biosynthesis glycosyltransferase TuaH